MLRKTIFGSSCFHKRAIFNVLQMMLVPFMGFMALGIDGADGGGTTEGEDKLLKKIKDQTDEQIKSLKSQIKTLEDKAPTDFNIKENEEYKSLVSKVNKLELKEEDNKDAKKGSVVKFFEESIAKGTTDKRDHGAATVIKAAALMTTANVLPNATDGLNQLFGNYIVDGIGSVPKPSTFMMPLINVTTQAGTENIWFVDRINEEGDAEFIAEGALKPLADGEYKEYKEEVKEVALRWKMSKRVMQHAPEVVTDFRTHTNELMEQKIDTVALIGDSAVDPLEFDGVIANAGAFVVPAALANFYYSANIYDAIIAVATQVRLANFNGQLTCILNTVWGAKMTGEKTTEGAYLNVPFASADGSMVGDVKVVFSNKADADVITLGDLKKFNVVIAENISYDEGYENDDFSKNLVSKKLESFLGSYFRPSDAGAIISDDIATVLAAIEEIPVV